MAEEKSVSEKLDAIFDAFNKRMDAADEERRADRAKLDAACSRMDAADEEKKADKAKKDAAEKEESEAKAKKDAADKEEAAKKDAAEKEEAAKKDAAEKEEQAKKDAAARAAAVNPDYAARLAAIEAGMLAMPATGSGADRKPYIDAQVKADPVYHAFGDSGAPPAMRGESVDGYQRRLLSRFKQHSPKWKDKDLAKLDASVLDIAEEQIYADATTAALHPADVPEGVLRRIESRDSAGRMRAHYVGSDERAAWAQFTNGGMTGRFLIPAKH
jgi:flagellar biosynthesis GTPase FlhF